MSDSQEATGSNWLQIGLAAVSQNFATGLAFGSFGTLVLAIETEYGASRAQSSLAISLLVISLAITASLLGRILEYASIRKVMAMGAVLAAGGFGLASLASQAWQLLAIYALILGPATGMLGVLPSMTQATRWSEERHRGLAMGIVNMPALVMVTPLVIAAILENEGVRAAYRALAFADICLIPILLFIMRDRPAVARQDSPSQPRPMASGSIVGSPIFWILIAGQGIISGAGMMKLAHFIPLLTEQGRTFNEANMLLALSGGAGLLGSFAFGALADRIGGAWALVLNGVIQAFMWTIFLAPVSYPILVADAIVVGACGGGVQAAFGTVLAALFGPRRFSRALGLASLFTLPFLFGLTPAASLLYEWSGSYHLPMGIMVAGLLGGAGLFTIVARAERRATKVHDNNQTAGAMS